MRRAYLKALIPAALATAFIACTGAAPPPEEEISKLELAPCSFDGLDEELRCGKLSVYEDREARSGRKIELNVVVAPALGESPEPDPVFYFEGGPGGAATANAAGLAQGLRSLREKRDLVMVDQRGTGGSHDLDCDVPGSPEDPQGYFEEYFPAEVVRTCRQKLEADADLTLYTTSIAMDDIDEVRRALGYQQINLVGGSYGTRAAQVYMRRHPETARSAILMGVAAMDQHIPFYHAPDAQQAMDLLLDACLEDEACGAAFPDVRTELTEVIERLKAEPATVEIPHPVTGEPVAITLSRESFAEGLRFLSYTGFTSVTVPLVIHQAHEGSFEAIAPMLMTWHKLIREIISFGMHLSVVCAEDRPFVTPEQAQELAAGTYLGDYRAQQIIDACELWPRGEIPAGYHDPVTVDVPTLLISGALDPVTPPKWAEEVDANLPSSLHVVVAHGHHSPEGGLTHPECIDAIIGDFLDRGSVEGLDTSCVETMKRGPFFTDPAALEALLAQFNAEVSEGEGNEGEAGAEGTETGSDEDTGSSEEGAVPG